MVYLLFIIFHQKSGVYSHSDICAKFEDTFFGDGTVYNLEKRNEFMKLRESGIAPNSQPVEGKWMHGSLLRFHENYRSRVSHENLGDQNITVILRI